MNQKKEFPLDVCIKLSVSRTVAVVILIVLQESRCAYVILIMAIYWMTEALPMAVTALLPIVMMPWLDVMGSKGLCSNYLKVSSFHFIITVSVFQ